MNGLDPTASTAENYSRFARHEAAGRSPLYEELAYAVANDALVLSFLAELPRPSASRTCSSPPPGTSWGARRTLRRYGYWWPRIQCDLQQS